MENVKFILQAISLAILLFSAVYLLGIIWRTEMKLDKSYKLLFIALSFLIIFEALEFLEDSIFWLENFKIILRFLFSLFFFLSIFEARSMLREVDGEKNEIQEQK